MSKYYQSYASTSPSKVDNAYILSLSAIAGDGIAAITSASELLVLDRQNLPSPATSYQDVPSNTTCLIRNDAQGQSVICSSQNGSVTTFDVRLQKKVAQFQIDRSVTAIASDGSRIALGTELKSQQAVVSLWDVRQNREVWRNGENNDDITVVDFHPNKTEVLLAGGDDGLVSLFDTSIQDEEESLLEAINHGPVHKAGFLDPEHIFALSSDQNLALYSVLISDDTIEPPSTPIGDLRPIVPCQYTIDVLRTGNDYVVAAGTNLEASRIDLIKLNHIREHTQQAVLDLSSKHVLEPAHGEEVVRAILIDGQTGVIFTAGEDGQIRAFRQTSANHISSIQASKTTKSKREKESEARYKPY